MKQPQLKIWEVKLAGGGGSGTYIRIVIAENEELARRLVFPGGLGKMANVTELDLSTNPSIIASYDFENENYDG
jgi:hypothetical protein